MSKKMKMETRKVNSVTVKGLYQMLDVYLKANKVLFIHGTFGAGKSAIVKDVAKKNEMTTVDIRISQMLPEDGGGIVFHGKVVHPETGEEIITSIRGMPDIIHQVWKERQRSKKPVLLFMDEFNSGSPSVMAAMYSILLDREAAGFQLPKDTRIVCAGNLEDDMSVVHDVPMAANNRVGHVWYEGPTIDEYERYMSDKNMHVSVMAFLRFNPQYLLPWKVDGDDIIDKTAPEIPTPRTWEDLSDALKILDEQGNKNPIFRKQIIASFVGSRTASMLEAVFEIIDKVHPYRDIIANPEEIPLPPIDDMKARYIQMLTTCAHFVQVAAEDPEQGLKDLPEFLKYFARFGKDMTVIGANYVIKAIDTANPVFDAMLKPLMGYVSTNKDFSWAKN